MKPLGSVLVKPAGPDCNLACDYCFYRGKEALFPSDGPRRMAPAVLEAVVAQVMEQSGPEAGFVWQGGEPALVGLGFYRQAVALQQRYGRAGQRVGNAFQTNGTLLDADWCRFFREYSFLVGLSLDGPEDVHDRHRRDRAGGPSWARVREAGRLLLGSGVAVNALCLVTAHSQGRARELYRFFLSEGFGHLQFIPCADRDPATGGMTEASVSPEGWGRFLCDLFDAWQEEPAAEIPFFDSVLHTYLGRTPPECTLREACGNYLVVEHNGDVFPCDFFVEPQRRLGNVLQDRLSDLFRGPRHRAFGRSKADLAAECGRCRWLASCRGGCPKHRFPAGGPPAPGYLCRSTKAFLEHADPAFRRLARPFQGRAPAERNAPCPCGSGTKFKNCCARTEGTA